MQSHIWLTNSPWKYLCICSYIRKPFLIYDFAPEPIWISLYIRKILFSFLSVQYLCYVWQRGALFTHNSNSATRREIIVRGQSYFSRLPKYWPPPPIPLCARWVCPPPATTNSPGGEGDGGSIFWKTREIGLPSYKDLSTVPHKTCHPAKSINRP